MIELWHDLYGASHPELGVLYSYLQRRRMPFRKRPARWRKSLTEAVERLPEVEGMLQRVEALWSQLVPGVGAQMMRLAARAPPPLVVATVCGGGGGGGDGASSSDDSDDETVWGAVEVFEPPNRAKRAREQIQAKSPSLAGRRFECSAGSARDDTWDGVTVELRPPSLAGALRGELVQEAATAVRLLLSRDRGAAATAASLPAARRERGTAIARARRRARLKGVTCISYRTQRPRRAAFSILSNSGVPRPVAASQPVVAFQP